MPDKEPPPFDSVERALVFAFNAGEAIHIASPVMNRAMAEVKTKPKVSKKARKKMGAEAAALLAPEVKASSHPPGQPGDRLQGLNKAHQAGLILQVIGRLDRHHANALAALYTQPTVPCQCQSPCCQGFRQTLRWSKAISHLCLHLKDEAPILGKPGLSTEPQLRRLIVTRYFLQDSTSTAAIARRAKASSITAAKHSELIRAYLEGVVGEAKEQIALLFDQEGITGFLE